MRRYIKYNQPEGSVIKINFPIFLSALAIVLSTFSLYETQNQSSFETRIRVSEEKNKLIASLIENRYTIDTLITNYNLCVGFKDIHEEKDRKNPSKSNEFEQRKKEFSKLKSKFKQREKEFSKLKSKFEQQEKEYESLKMLGHRKAKIKHIQYQAIFFKAYDLFNNDLELYNEANILFFKEELQQLREDNESYITKVLVLEKKSYKETLVKIKKMQIINLQTVSQLKQIVSIDCK